METMGPFEWGDKLPTLTGARVELRWLTDDDAAALLEVFGDPEVMRYWSSAPMKGIEDARTLVAEIQGFFRERHLFQWGIIPRGAKAPIGTCTLLAVSAAHRRAEVGFALARSHWGRGLAGDALATLVTFAFETLGLHRLEADVDPDNERSLRLLERFGFRREGLLRERWHLPGRVCDSVMMGLLQSEWRKRPEETS